MTDANVARHQGDDFQARLFWLKATALLDPKSNVVRVSYELDQKASMISLSNTIPPGLRRTRKVSPSIAAICNASGTGRQASTATLI